MMNQQAMNGLAAGLTQMVADPHWAISEKCDEIYTTKRGHVRHTLQDACIFCFKEGFITVEELAKVDKHWGWGLFNQ